MGARARAGGCVALAAALLLAGCAPGGPGDGPPRDDALEAAEQEQQDLEDSTGREDGSVGLSRVERADLADLVPLAVGTAADVGPFTVVVAAVDPDADDVVAAADAQNGPPTHRYVLVDLAVTNGGAGEASPFWELDTAFLGTDGRKYPATECWPTLPRGGALLPPAPAGVVVEYQVCMDVPPTAVAGGTVRVAPVAAAPAAHAAHWSVPAS